MGVGSLAGGLLGGSGSKQSQTIKPWAGVRQPLLDLYGNVGSIAPQQFYPGQTYVGGLPQEEAAFGGMAGYNQSMYGSNGNYSGTPFGNVFGAMNNSTTGRDTLGQMSNALGGAATGGLMGAFGQGPQQLTSGGIGSLTPTFGQAGGLDARGTLQQMLSGQANWGGAGMVSGAGNAPLAGGQFNAGLQQQPDFRSAFGSAGMANAGMGQFGTAGNLNATGAINQALSGQGDYGGLQQAIDAANAPILRQFNEEIIPGLNSRATFLSNPTGGIKTLNRVMPEIGQRMNENAATLTEGERRRALDSQQNAMGLVSQGGLAQGSQASSQLYGAGQSALDRATAQRQQASSQLYGAAGQMGAQNYGAYGNAFDQSMQDRSGAAGLISQGGLSSYGLGLQGATTNANLAGQYRSDLLGLGNLAGGLASDQSQSAARWGALFPGLAESGRAPYEDMGAYAQYQRGLQEQQLADQMDRFNFAQQEPYNRYNWQSGILQNSPYQSSTTSGGSSGLGALGGAIAGGQLGSILANSFMPQRGYSGINPANYPISVPNNMDWIFNTQPSSAAGRF